MKLWDFFGGRKKTNQDEELVLIGWISNGMEPWYAKKSDYEKWKKEKTNGKH